MQFYWGCVIEIYKGRRRRCGESEGGGERRGESPPPFTSRFPNTVSSSLPPHSLPHLSLPHLSPPPPSLPCSSHSLPLPSISFSVSVSDRDRVLPLWPPVQVILPKNDMQHVRIIFNPPPLLLPPSMGLGGICQKWISSTRYTQNWYPIHKKTWRGHCPFYPLRGNKNFLMWKKVILPKNDVQHAIVNVFDINPPPLGAKKVRPGGKTKKIKKKNHWGIRTKS